MDKLEEKTLTQLKQIAKDMGIKGINKLRKNELVQEILKISETSSLDTSNSLKTSNQPNPSFTYQSCEQDPDVSSDENEYMEEDKASLAVSYTHLTLPTIYAV